MKKPHEDDFEVIKQFQVPSDKVFIDIGTKREESILSMTLINNTKNPVIGFEPNPYVFKKSQSELSKTRHARIHNVGLASTTGSLELNDPFYPNWMFDGFHPLTMTLSIFG